MIAWYWFESRILNECSFFSWLWKVIYLLLILDDSCQCFPNPSLVRRIGFFQPIMHQTVLVPDSRRLKRSSGPVLIVWFLAFDRKFILKLENMTSLFSPTAKIKVLNEKGEETIPIDLITRHLVQGKLVSEPISEVSGSFYDGVFTGSIQTDSEMYFVEFSESFFNVEMPFKTFIYRGSDVQNHNIIPERRDSSSSTANIKSHSTQTEKMRSDLFETHRMKRQPEPKDTCHVKIITDHTFYQRFSNQMHLTTFFEMIGIFNQVNSLFLHTRFFEEDPAHVIGFMIQEIQIIVKQDEVNYFMSELEMSSTEFLEYLSLYDFNDFCLAICLVKRSFTDGQFGASYLAKPAHSHEGGICSTWNSQEMKSKNIAVVSLVAENHRLPNAVIVVSLTAHLGRLFGSDYDPPDDPKCSPPSSDPFVMYNCNSRKCFRRVQFKFSNCSIRQIDQLLQIKSTCLNPPYVVCGNGVVEGEEECDCGPSETCDMLDKCCNPTGAWSIVGEAKPCRLREGSECSAKSSFCCTDDCKFPSPKERPDCNSGNECLEPAYCDSVNHVCPKRRLKPDGSYCAGTTGKCKAGDCEIDICEKNKTAFCHCPEPDFSCAVCCKAPNGKCVPAAKLKLFKPDGMPFRLRQGMPCFEGIGECSSQGFCNAMAGWTILENKKKTEKENENQLILYFLFFVGIVMFLIIAIIVCSYIIYKLIKYRKRKEEKNKKNEEGSKKKEKEKKIENEEQFKETTQNIE